MSMSVLNFWLTALEAQSPLSLPAPHQGQLVHKTSFLWLKNKFSCESFPVGSRAPQRRTYTRVSTWCKMKGIFCDYKLFSNKVICRQLGNFGMDGLSSSKQQSTAPSLHTCRQGVKLQTSPDKHTNLGQQNLSIHGFKQVQRAATGLGKEFSEDCRGSIHQLTKYGDISRTSICPMHITSGWP